MLTTIDTRTIAIAALVFAVLALVLLVVHAFLRVPPAHSGLPL